MTFACMICFVFTSNMNEMFSIIFMNFDLMIFNKCAFSVNSFCANDYH